jgi:hypothetical protein
MLSRNIQIIERVISSSTLTNSSGKTPPDCGTTVKTAGKQKYKIYKHVEALCKKYKRE